MCLGRVKPGPTGPWRVEIGAPIEGLRSRGVAVVDDEVVVAILKKVLRFKKAQRWKEREQKNKKKRKSTRIIALWRSSHCTGKKCLAVWKLPETDSKSALRGKKCRQQSMYTGQPAMMMCECGMPGSGWWQSQRVSTRSQHRHMCSVHQVAAALMQDLPCKACANTSRRQSASLI